ncbi:MFS transporter [Saccharopolyspora hirsuta]|uniref:MFS transporter n=2 Tax=Saccharopolyspora hirsuta TaxID=1837 RepID=UPI0033246FC8
MPQSSSRARIGMGLLGLSSLITGLDFTIVYVALPDVQRELAFTSGQVQWVVTSYALAFGGFLLLFGRLSDLLGRRRVFLFGMLLFLAGSIAGTFALGPAMLLAARAVQGLGAAALFPSTLALVTSTFPEGPLRRRAMTIWAASGASGLSAGALAGGILTGMSWRGVFAVNVPLAVIAIAGGLAVFSRDPSRSRGSGFDLMGACTGTAAATLLVLTIVQVSEPGTSPVWLLVSAASTLVLALLFVRTEARTQDPLLPLSLLAHRPLRAALVLITIFGISLQSIPYVLTIHLRTGLGLTAWETGLAFLLPTGAITLGNLVGERLLLRVGLRAVLIGGLISGAAGTGLVVVTGTADVATIAPGVLLAGLGMGLVFPAMFTAATTGVPAEHGGVASATASSALQIGTAIGLALVTWLLHTGPDGLLTTLAAIGGVALVGTAPAFAIPTRTPGHRDPARIG